MTSLSRIVSSNSILVALTAAVLSIVGLVALWHPHFQENEMTSPVVVAVDEQQPEATVEKVPPVVELAPEPLDLVQSSIANYINRSYRIPMKEARAVTEMAVRAGEARDLDPLLILAVIGTESSFNPNARSHAGAEGLMQVMTQVHKEKFEKFGGHSAAFDPEANIEVGADILATLIRRTGSVRRALKFYSGAANLPNDRGYGTTVLQEWSRFVVAAQGDSNRAVMLSRGKRPAPNYSLTHAGSVSGEGYARWVSLTEETKPETSLLPATLADDTDKGQVTTL